MGVLPDIFFTGNFLGLPGDEIEEPACYFKFVEPWRGGTTK